MRKILTYSSSSCTGCRYCEIACSFEHFGVCGRNRSLIRIVTEGKKLVNTALFCHHCKKPVCINACPVDAISRNEETGLVSVDSEKCTGCAICIEECPLGGIHIDEESGLAVNCDLCNGKPTCVEFCPTQALRYVVPGEARRTKAAISLLTEKR